jgi:predicted ester cyclase
VSETNEASVKAAVAAFNDPDRRERYFELYAPDVALHGFPGDVQGREGLRSYYSQLWSAWPDVQMHIDEVLADNDRLASRYTLTGTDSATDHAAVNWFHFRDGLVVEAWQISGDLAHLTTHSSAGRKEVPRHSASAAAAALRWEERHPNE